MKLIVLSLLTLGLCLPGLAEPDKTDRPEPGAEILENYFRASQGQREALKGLSMDVLMNARLSKMKKEGRMSALRSISNLGKITYKVLGFWGDDTVKREVMARFMTAETQAKDDGSQIAINHENYKFKYKGVRANLDSYVHLFELKPRHKRVGLFKGELWIDAKTYLPVRETGQLVKNPSIFIKKMEFVRDFEIREGMAVPLRFEGKTDTRVAGKAELNIEYANVHREQAVNPVAAETWAEPAPKQP